MARGKGVERLRTVDVPSPADMPQLLRAKLWEPLEPSLRDCRTVLLVPDGALHRLPWAALPGRDPRQFLLEEYALATLSHGEQGWTALTQPLPAGNVQLLVGGVDYDHRLVESHRETSATGNESPSAGNRSSEPWQSLGATREEIESIQALTPSFASPAVLAGSAAHEDALRRELPQCRYVHLATHGFFADERFRSLYGFGNSADQLIATAGTQLATDALSTVTHRNPLLLCGVILAGGKPRNAGRRRRTASAER